MSGTDTPPEALDVDGEAVPEKLRNREQWVNWRYSHREGEWTKLPINPATNNLAKSTDADTWGTYADAVELHERDDTDTAGIGFVVTEEDLFVGLDLDDCRDPDTGEIDAWAREVVEAVPTYAEVSPSGTGLRAFGLGVKPDGKTRADIDGEAGHIEIYDDARYLTVTGHQLEAAPGEVCQVNTEIEGIHEEHIKADKPTPDGGLEPQTEDANPTPEAGKQGSEQLTDSQIIEKAKQAENGDKFRRLWKGDTSGHPSHSEADLALCGMLAFWTGGDTQQIDRLFRQSGLCREKWEEREDYRERTIDEAVSGRSEFYEPGAKGPDTPPEPTIDEDSINRTLTPSEVLATAGVDEDTDISDLTDREKAGCVWEILKHTDEFHVRVRRDNRSLWAYNNGVWSPEGERALEHAARRALGPMNYGDNVRTQLKAQARADPTVEVEADTFGLECGYVAVKNGRLDLEAAAKGDYENSIQELQPGDYALARLPVEYDPGATGEEWREFVDEVAEEGKADTLQEYVGYCLHRSEIPFNKALLLVGSGSNGKSTFLNVVRALLGEEHTATKPVHKFDDDNHVADLHGALANIDADLSEGSLSGAGIATFKRLLGGDQVDARKLYQDAFTFEPTAKHLYACNQVPDVSNYVSDQDIAFWRRWVIVQFPNYFPPHSRDEELEERLTTEDTLSGILNWAIEGWDRLLSKGGFTDADNHEETRKKWQAWGESVDEFMAECVERDPDADRITTSQAHQRYEAWCRERDKDSVGQRQFTDTLKEQDVGYKSSIRIDGKIERGYDALGLTGDVPELEDGEENGDEGAAGAQARFD